MSYLFSPYTIKDLQLNNRIVMSPMCMYSSDDHGEVKDFHKIHYTTRAIGGVGLIIQEATAVDKQGRISENDLGIWDDAHIAGLKELTDLVHTYGAKIGIQLAHAGRKANISGPIYAPSPIKFSDAYKVPHELSQDEIARIVQAFREATLRAKLANYDVIEIHAAHGYLINEFLSPLTNKRTDRYGGDRTGRFTFLREIIEQVKLEWDGPLFVRISANEYHEDGNKLEDFLYYASEMKKLGVDLIDCSSGAVVPANIDVYPGYQVKYAETLRKKVKIATGAVGLITEAQHAEEIIANERADLVFLGRVLLREPYWAIQAAKELNVSVPVVKQYERGYL